MIKPDLVRLISKISATTLAIACLGSIPAGAANSASSQTNPDILSYYEYIEDAEIESENVCEFAEVPQILRQIDELTVDSAHTSQLIRDYEKRERIKAEKARKKAEAAEKKRAAEEAKKKAEEAEKKAREEAMKNVSSTMKYTASQFEFRGRIKWSGFTYTWYSEKVLPGNGLRIPGRYVDDNGYIRDEDGYLCLATDAHKKGTVIPTPFGSYGKVYDCGCGTTIDVYVSW